MIQPLNVFSFRDKRHLTVLGQQFKLTALAISLLSPTRAPGVVPGFSFDRATGASVKDFLGQIQDAKPGELRMANARRVENLLPKSQWVKNSDIWGEITVGSPVVSTDGSGWLTVTCDGDRHIQQFTVDAKLGEEYFLSVDVETDGTVPVSSILFTLAPTFATEIIEPLNGTAPINGRVTIKATCIETGSGLARVGFGSAGIQTGTVKLKNASLEKAVLGQTQPSEFVSVGENLTDGIQVLDDPQFVGAISEGTWTTLNTDANNTVTFENGTMYIVSDGTAPVGSGQTLTGKVTTGVQYRLTFDVTESIGNGVKLLTLGEGQIGGAYENGSHALTFTASASEGLTFYRYSGVSGGRVSNVSLERIVHHGYGVDNVKYFDTDLNGDPITLPIGMLVESAATNFINESEYSFSTRSTGTGTFEDADLEGFSAAFRYTGKNGSGNYCYKNTASGLQVGDEVCVSAYVEMDDGGIPVAGNSVTGDFTLICCTNGANSNIKSEHVRGNLYRVSGTRVLDSVSNSYSGVAVYDSQSGRTFKMSGVQIEKANSPSSYIKTTGSAVARESDAIEFTHGIKDFDTKGTVIVDFISDLLVPLPAIYSLVSSSDSTDLLYCAIASGRITTYDGTTGVSVPGDVNDGEIHRAAVSWGPQGMIIAVDGDSDTAPFVGNTRGNSTTVKIGEGFNGVITNLVLQ